MQYREKDLDSGGRFFLALVISTMVHATLLAVIVISSAWAAKRQVINVRDTVFVTPVNPPRLQKQPDPAPKPPSAPEPPRVKKSAMKAPAKKAEQPKIVPKGRKLKPPEKTKPAPPPPPPPPKPAPQRPVRQQPQNFRTEGEEFKYEYYVKIVKRKVEENWITHGLDSSGQVNSPEVYFRIQRDGSMSGVRLEKSSGSQALDQSALEAVRKSSFPPLPAGYRGDSLGVYYNFEYVQRD